MSKIDRAVRGPGWAEVILGAVLSLLLGAVLAAAVLMVRTPGKEPAKPEERKTGVVYYTEGSKDTSKARQMLAKRKAFVEGQSVTVSEEEINAMIAADAPPAGQAKATAPKAGAKKDPKAKTADPAAGAPDTGETMAVGTPNVRIRGGALQVAAPVTLNALGLSEKVIVQARGGFVKKDNVFTYEPAEMYVGSCPVERLPGINRFVRNRILAAKPIPEDIATAWRKLSDVAIDGNVVRLSP